MITAWMLGAALFAALMGVAAWCAEYALRGTGRQGRGPWLFALVAGATWPLVAPFMRNLTSGSDGVSTAAVRLPVVHVLPDGVSVASPLVEIAILSLWATASIILLARLSGAVSHLRRVRAGARRRTVDGVPVLVSATMGPAVVGVLQPQVLLPESLLDLDESLRRVVLRHEQEHCRAHDQWIVVGSSVILALLPWNVPLWWVARRSRLALELDCDRRVLAEGTNPNQYGKLLLLIAQHQGMTALAPMLAATSHLERRIIAMQTTHTTRRWTRIALAAAGMAIAVIAACTSSTETSAPGSRDADPTSSAGNARMPVVAPELLYEFQVEKQAQQIPGTGNVRYPASLRQANVQGLVLAQFVVDENGRYYAGSFKALKSSHALFTLAVQDALATMRFYPAEVGGKKVKQLVHQPFTFSLSGDGITEQFPAYKKVGPPMTGVIPFHR
jgi:bla regulator protein blaR1